MRVALYIPFWGEDPTRISALAEVLDKMNPMFPWAYEPLLCGISTQHRGKARNSAVMRAIDDGIDVAVICDADSYPQKDSLSAAIFAADHDGGIHFPHDQVIAYNKYGRVAQAYGPSAGGCWVARPDEWARIGWMEERGGWSVDDRTFLCQINTLGGGPVYHRGILTCLWHTPEVRTVLPEDQALIQRYLDAEGDPEAIRRLISERA